MSSPDQVNQRESSPSINRRRSSLVDMFNPRSSMSSQGQPPRRLSITTLGLSTLPGAQTSPFSNIRARAESTSSANSGSVDESPFEDDNVSSPSNNTSASVPVTPFGRRMSFGAQQRLRSSIGGQIGTNANGTANGRPPVSSANFANKASASSPPTKSREGFDFAETLRARAERSSISGGFGGFMTNQQNGQQSPPHNRTKSLATMDPPPKAEVPKLPTRPDAFQERILKGDFYMD